MITCKPPCSHLNVAKTTQRSRRGGNRAVLTTVISDNLLSGSAAPFPFQVLPHPPPHSNRLTLTLVSNCLYAHFLKEKIILAVGRGNLWQHPMCYRRQQLAQTAFPIRPVTTSTRAVINSSACRPAQTPYLPSHTHIWERWEFFWQTIKAQSSALKKALKQIYFFFFQRAHPVFCKTTHNQNPGAANAFKLLKKTIQQKNN